MKKCEKISVENWEELEEKSKKEVEKVNLNEQFKGANVMIATSNMGTMFIGAKPLLEAALCALIDEYINAFGMDNFKEQIDIVYDHLENKNKKESKKED